jgi:hypothetical protein
MAFSSNVSITNLGKAIINNRLIANTQPLPIFLAVGTGAETAARTADPTDTGLSAEVESRVGSNAPTIVTTTTSNDTWQIIQTITATGNRGVDEAMLFDKSSGGNSFISATFSEVNLASGDSIQLTFKAKMQ